jgi:imidazolonepropionase-like amidohydrolase
MLITNVHILPIGDQKEYKEGYILTSGDRILSIGPMVDAPKWQEVMDGNGAYALPGFVDAHSHVGLFGIGEQDANEEKTLIAPHFRVVDSLNLTDVYWKEALLSGVTTTVVSPGSNAVMGGQIAAIDTHTREVLRAPIGIKCALGENPKKSGEVQTRMAEVALIRETLAKASKYAEKTNAFDFVMNSLKPVIKKKLPLFIHAHTEGDIQAAIRISEEFNISIKLLHATQSANIAKTLADYEIGVICGPMINHRSKMELADFSPALPAILAVNGVKTAIATDHPEVPAGHLALSAALAVKAGMPPLDALEAITINAAEICGIADVVGSLETDKYADILLYDKYPLEFYVSPKCIISRGKVVMGVNEQTHAAQV